MEKVDLICLPFAGGSRYSYRKFEEKVPASLNIIPLEYPGRGSRIMEPLCDNMATLVDDIYHQLSGRSDHAPYALFGHSMGAIASLFLLRKLMAAGAPLPIHVFISGCAHPSCILRDQSSRHTLERHAFIDELRVMDGCPPDLLENEDMMDFLEPIIRSDFKASETFVLPAAAPVPVPFTVFTGTEEDLADEDILLWQQECAFTADFRKLTGGHFFILEHATEILDVIAKNVLLTVKNS